MKLRGEDLRRFEAKFPKKQLITKEQLAIYLTTIARKPHIVSKGKNWTIKEFGAAIREEYKNHRESFNEFYFKKCVCATIIFRTVDDYLERNKDSVKRPTGFWYKTGGYKLNIVPYTIAKIIDCIPQGYTLDWNKIWNQQSLSSAFMREIEIVTRMTNDFICDSHGMIVTEYCKKQSTWEAFRDKVEYQLSKAFLDELIPAAYENQVANAAKKEQKETNDLQVLMTSISKGYKYWNQVYHEGINRSLLTYQERASVQQMMQMAETGKIPSSRTGKLPHKIMETVSICHMAEEKLMVEGIM